MDRPAIPLSALAGLLAIIFVWALSLPSQAQETPPNIVLVVVDDLGWADVGFNGNARYDTPRLDSLAGEGLVFTQAYAAAANCAPSRATIMSGRYAPYHGIYTVGNSDRGKDAYRRLVPTPNNTVLADSVVSLPEQLARAGYHSIHIGKWHLGADARTQGFNRNVAGYQAGHPKTYFSPFRLPFLADRMPGENLTDRLTDEAIQYVHEQAGRPFFLYLPYYAVHTPLEGKPELVEKYRGRPGIRNLRQATYAAMVETMDHNVGRLMQAIHELGLDENTLFIFTSDNGGIAALTPQDPLRAGKGSYYEGGIRVPTFFRWPGKISAGQSEAPVIHHDLYPTLLHVVGLAPDRKLDGLDLLPHLLRGESLPERPLFWHFPIYLQAYQPGADGGRDPLFRTRPGSVLRSGNWKLHHYFEDNGLELYNLSTDPGEQHDLAAEEPERARRLFDTLEAWRQANGAPVPATPNPDYDAAVEQEAIRQVE